MKTYHACIECGSPLGDKRGTRGLRKFCDKSCAQSFRNRKRAVRLTPEPPPETGVRFVPLTQGKFAKVDEADFADVSRWNWCAWKSKGTHYAIRNQINATGAYVSLLLHRYLMGEPVEDIDHKNGDGLDNRRENLRKATPSQNGRNQMKRSKSSSRFKGVSLIKGVWRAYVRLNYKTTHLGRFDTEEEAARAYDEAARRLHGEFARVNFPRDGEQSALQK